MGSSTEHPVPAAHLAIQKQRREARVSYRDGLQQSPLHVSIGLILAIIPIHAIFACKILESRLRKVKN
ncbi:MAG: hypothetical protein EZS28_038815 [Streblomastix strix]|uniref:Uncharacterized protein n=1 Tax=Streblomastix strix TaxID=222440 RepID=A0A5J4U4X9_9EUKA|nr:MAG: hypothetical protein EZS28_038815 [Streblomastix strix]